MHKAPPCYQEERPCFPDTGLPLVVSSESIQIDLPLFLHHLLKRTA